MSKTLRSRRFAATLTFGLLVALCACPALAQPAASAGDKAIGVADIQARDTLGAQRFAVIIGINDYADGQIPDLKFAESDARAMYAVLTDPRVGGIAPDHARLLLGKDATAREIRKALTDLRTIPKDATVFLFFSGHGAKEAGEAFWVTQDAELGSLAATALSNIDLQRYLGQIPSQRVITLLDCCYAAATVKEQKSVIDLAEALKQFVGKGRVTITASGSGEEAIEAAGLRQGVFTHFLAEGLRGKADGTNGPADGVVTVPELTAYIEQTVADAARQRRGIQKPAVFMEEVQDPGKFLLTVDPERLAALAEAARRATATVQAQLDTLKQLFMGDQLTAEQYRLGKSLVEAAADKLDAQDRERLEIFRELIAGKLEPKRLQALLDAVETPAQRAATATSPGPSPSPSTLAPAPMSPPPAMQGLRPAAPETADTLTLDCGSGVPLKLKLIPAGEFTMGSPESEVGRGWDEVQHRVRISQAFYIGIYEVTQAQWQAVMGSNPSHFTGDLNRPVEQVSWDDCQRFCLALVAKNPGRDVRLPTEAEWEYACRAGSTGRFSFGDSDGALGSYAWFYENSGSTTHAVGQKQPNAWGLYDMHGNVWEWCQDWDDAYPSVSVADPAGPGRGVSRVLRGGSLRADTQWCRAAKRFCALPRNRLDNAGLRVVVSGAAAGTP